MLVKTLEELKAQGVEKIVSNGLASTTRFLLKSDGLGFTMSDVHLGAGVEVDLWYKNHWEANYIVSGTGSVTDLRSEKIWELNPGTTYTVGPRDRHHVSAQSDLHIISIFNPPLTGDETHDKDGSYDPSGEIPPGRGRMFVKTLDELAAQGRKIRVAQGTTSSTRILLTEDGLGFTLCDVNLSSGENNSLWYKNHWEANYILHGHGEVKELDTGQTWALVPGTMYIVGPKDRHSMHAQTDLHLLSIFNPPLTGSEQHDEDGALPPTGNLPPGPAIP